MLNRIQCLIFGHSFRPNKYMPAPFVFDFWINGKKYQHKDPCEFQICRRCDTVCVKETANKVNEEK
jgi:hypothetical protein